MVTRGELLLRLIEDKGYNLMSFSKISGVAYTTIRSMIERDLSNASIDNVIKICEVLNVRIEIFNPANVEKIKDVASYQIETIAAHHEGEEWTESELKELEEFKKFVLMKRQGRTKGD